MPYLPEHCRECGSTLIENRRENDDIIKTCIQCRHIISREYSPIPVCQTCSNKVDNGGDYCSSCLARQRSEIIVVQTQKHICPKCGIEGPGIGLETCESCFKPVADASKQNGNVRSKMRSAPKRTSSPMPKVQLKPGAPKCVHCSKPAVPGIKHCSDCRKNKMERSSRWRANNVMMGLCTRCGGTKDDDQYRTCKQCRDANAKFKRERRMKSGPRT